MLAVPSLSSAFMVANHNTAAIAALAAVILEEFDDAIMFNSIASLIWCCDELKRELESGCPVGWLLVYSFRMNLKLTPAHYISYKTCLLTNHLQEKKMKGSQVDESSRIGQEQYNNFMFLDESRRYNPTLGFLSLS